MNNLTNFNLDKTTTEILMLKDQTAQNIIEIGKRLIDVKENTQHGEYLKWLEEKVDFTERTAQRFVKVATAFSNTTLVSHLGSRKLFALAGLDEEDRKEVIQENNIENMTARELEQVVKEKKEIRKQLEAEQEYSEELHQAIKEKDNEINDLKKLLEAVQKPEKEIIEREVIKEVIPNKIQEKIKKLEEDKEQLRNKLEKSESALKSVKLESNLEKDNVYYKNNLDLLLANIKDFLDRASKYTYFKEELQTIPKQKKRFIEKGVASVKDWVILMEQALDNREDVLGDLIYGEGEIIDE